MNRFLAAATFVPAALAQSYYYGCYTEVPGRALTGSSLIDYENMTPALCEAHCEGFELWGLEYSGECYCGDLLASGSFPAFSTDCGMPCSGDPEETCGGPNRLSLYGVSEEPPAVSPYPHDPPVTTTEYVGCYTELSAGRALSGASAFSLTDMTIEGCGYFCRESGFLWFGLEYTAECFCGTELHEESTLANEEDCFMACSGEPETVCGGPNRLSVYKWTSEDPEDPEEPEDPEDPEEPEDPEDPEDPEEPEE